MLVCLPFCARDKSNAIRLAEWIAELGGVSAHDCLLVVHKDTDSASVIEPLTKAFGRVAEFTVSDDVIYERERYVYAANIMWKRTANHIADMNEPMPWLWLEPDAAPLRDDWLDLIAAEYKEGCKPFMHELVSTPSGQRNSGTGIYPARVRDYTDRLWQLSDTSWDVLLGPDFLPHTHHTKLIQDSFCMFGNPEILPTFPDAGSLNFIRKGVVLFHRCKDGTLIDRLKEMANPAYRDASYTIPQTKPFEGAVGQGIPVVYKPEEYAAPLKLIVHEKGESPSITEQMRAHCEGLRKLVGDKPGRRVMAQTELRKAGLMAAAKKRK